MAQSQIVDRSAIRRVRARCVAAKKRADVGEDIRWGLILKMAAGLSCSVDGVSTTSHVSEAPSDAERKAKGQKRIAKGLSQVFARALHDDSDSDSDGSASDAHSSEQTTGDSDICDYADAALVTTTLSENTSELSLSAVGSEWNSEGQERVAKACAGVFERALLSDSDSNDSNGEVVVKHSYDDCSTTLGDSDCGTSHSGAEWDAKGEMRVAKAFVGVFARALRDDSDGDSEFVVERSHDECCSTTTGGSFDSSDAAADAANFEDDSSLSGSGAEWDAKGQERVAKVFARVFATALNDDSESDGSDDDNDDHNDHVARDLVVA